jgi:hypothetical protein
MAYTNKTAIGAKMTNLVLAVVLVVIGKTPYNDVTSTNARALVNPVLDKNLKFFNPILLPWQSE